MPEAVVMDGWKWRRIWRLVLKSMSWVRGEDERLVGLLLLEDGDGN